MERKEIPRLEIARVSGGWEGDNFTEPNRAIREAVPALAPWRAAGVVFRYGSARIEPSARKLRWTALESVKRLWFRAVSAKATRTPMKSTRSTR
jgi:hypothetical protein